MHDVKNEERKCSKKLYFISLQQCGHYDQIEKEKNRFSRDDPPVYHSVLSNNQVKHSYARVTYFWFLTLVDQAVERSLLHDRRDANV
jgi:hypothetical protein